MKSTTILAKKYGVTSQTIREWIKSGRLKGKVTRTKGGHFRFIEEIEERKFIYARVSSAKQKKSIDKQLELLSKKYPKYEQLFDIASAFNFQRKGLKTILESAMSGTSTKVVVTTQDRIARSGFGLIKWIIELHGGEIITLEEDSQTKEQFDTKELIGFITSFCNSYYGKRSAVRRKFDKNFKES
jgi:predicted site-specific integrase-resolvase